MSRRLIFATLSLGVMMACTLVTAKAADYRKEKTEKYIAIYDLTAAVISYKIEQFHFVDFLVPANEFVFSPKVMYVFPGNEPKPDNRQVNGLINDRREQERICAGLNL